MSTDKPNKNRTNSKPPTLPTPEQEASATKDEPVRADAIAQTIGSCVAFHVEYGEVEEIDNLGTIATLFRATHRWHIERAGKLARGEVAA